MIGENINKVIRAVRDPQLISEEMKRLYTSSLFGLHKKFGKYKFQSRYGKGENVMQHDWDYLILLDACRYDIFKSVIDFDQKDIELDSIISVGSHSEEFIENTFVDNQFLDTVYITANGYGAKLATETFHDLIFTDVDGYVKTTEHTHPSWAGLSPSVVHDSAVEAHNRYPNKRLIIHFMQPHSPYFGEKAEHLRDDLTEEGVLVTQRKSSFEKKNNDSLESVSTLSYAAKMGYIDPSDLLEVYVDNLIFVMDYVRSLVDNLDGKIVLSADHGELLGEKIGFGKYVSPKHITVTGGVIEHPKGVYVRELREVPWVTINSSNRPQITEDPPRENQKVDNDVIESRLEALGYR